MIWLAILIGAALLLLMAAMLYLAWYLRWETEQTTGMAYYGRPLAERRALKQRIQTYSAPVKPLVHLLPGANVTACLAGHPLAGCEALVTASHHP